MHVDVLCGGVLVKIKAGVEVSSTKVVIGTRGGVRGRWAFADVDREDSIHVLSWWSGCWRTRRCWLPFILDPGLSLPSPSQKPARRLKVDGRASVDGGDSV